MRAYVVDSFTDTPFRGNPAVVCLLDGPLDDARMLAIAQEWKHSETAYVSPCKASGRFRIRFFSPRMEIPLCGHASLAAARVLFELHSLEAVTLVTGNGVDIPARRSGGRIVFSLPAYATRPAEVPPAMLDALGLDEVENAEINDELKILLVEIVDTTRLVACTPDFAALEASHDRIHGVVVTARSLGDEYDFHSRYFWPWSGTDEDPVTGGTHTFLAPYWKRRLGKDRLRSFQASSRTGFMEVEVRGDSVIVRADAVIVFAGKMRI